jgi:GH24 family phage-related lysozyme (muramidase)
MLMSERALKLIVDFEGLNQPGKWPGGASGITLGYGYDLGHVTASQFRADWAGCFSADHARRLARCIGCTGAAARHLATSVADIRCTAADSRRVLVAVSLPVYLARTRQAFPGFDVLPLDVQGALVSLVYNRGARMADSPGTDNRREMRAIRDLVARGLVVGIAEQLRSMKRLWEGKGLDGLIRRREAEAQLVESAIEATLRSLGGTAAVPAGEPVPVGTRARGGVHGTRARGPNAFGASRKAVVVEAWRPRKTKSGVRKRAAKRARLVTRPIVTGRRPRRIH